jgi:6-phosphogluconolactonase (cycloisomerase 2 family)
MKGSQLSQLRAAVLAAFAVFLLGSAGSAFAQQNLVYVDINSGVTNGNAVGAYLNDGAGNLTPVAGSPFKTGGTGVAGLKASGQGSYDADQQIIVNSAGTLLLAVNAHSNSVASFSINSDGSLTTVPGSPFASNGRDPASLGLFDGILGGGNSILTVVDKDADPKQPEGVPGYVNFQLTSSGVMSMMTGSRITLPAGTNPSQALTDTSLNLVFTDEFQGKPSTITARMLNTTSGKMAMVSSVDAPDGAVMLGEVLHPTQNILYATLAASGGLAVFNFDSSGNLSLSTWIADVGNTICWLAINQAGTRLYSGNNGDGTVTVFDLTNPESPVVLQVFQLSGVAPHTNNVRVDPTQQFLYALDGENLHVLSISQVDGTLTEPGAPVVLPAPAKNVATGIATLLLN